ncbi:MAG: hypothetical protein Q4C25_05025 [Bacillota bacterium]|nr:hypothetical protein [Bacillota bacterium]
MHNMTQIADEAQLIVNGYAFTKDGSNIKVLNLHEPAKATLMMSDGEIIETSMDDIELDIIQEYYARNKKYMEE